MRPFQKRRHVSGTGPARFVLLGYESGLVRPRLAGLTGRLLSRLSCRSGWIRWWRTGSAARG